MKQAEAMQLYVDVMGEVKTRLTTARYATVKGLEIIPNFMIEEFCFLQLRMAAELIALGCLVVHGDIEKTRTSTMQREWSPEKILRRLNELHREFYPEPMTQESLGPGRFHFTPIKTGFLARAELPKLYKLCGDALHRGSLRKLVTDKNPPQRYPLVQEWLKKIEVLLGCHHIVHIDRRTRFVCLMNPDGGPVQLVKAGAVDDAT